MVVYNYIQTQNYLLMGTLGYLQFLNFFYFLQLEKNSMTVCLTLCINMLLMKRLTGSARMLTKQTNKQTNT